MKNILFVLLMITIFVTSCKEPFAPAVDANEQILVVDGLISNVAENYTVKLYLATPYGSSSVRVPVINAVVTIKDNMGNSVSLHESSAGSYQSNTDEFTGIIGNAYTLFISTATGETYESSPQMMEEPLPIDSIYGKISTKKSLSEMSDGSTVVNTLNGITSYINIKRTASNNSNFRFINKLLIEVTASGKNPIPGGISPTAYYGWHLKNLDDLVNITGSEYGTSTSNIIDHELNFFTTQKSYYSVPDTQTVYHYLIVAQEYAINTDSYKYYKDINAQLDAGEELFVPISSQLRSNMHSTGTTQKTVLGLFEASARISFTYIVRIDNIANTVTYKKANDIGTIPDDGMAPINTPIFWQ